jgi:hypothetical protein
VPAWTARPGDTTVGRGEHGAVTTGAMPGSGNATGLAVGPCASHSGPRPKKREEAVVGCVGPLHHTGGRKREENGVGLSKLLGCGG